MNHIGLFEGIGGFSLAARWMGWETIAWCEINPFGQKVLKYHFPKATGHADIKSTDFTIYRGKCDILTGGFPCQPYSAAGKRLGTEDDRHLWPEMLRAIREIQPGYVVGENVRGLTNWNGGLVFDQVQADLEAEGYQVLPFLLPACAVNAPHRRDRIWFVAYSNSWGWGKGAKCKLHNDSKWKICENIKDNRNKVWCITCDGEPNRTSTNPNFSTTGSSGESGSPESNWCNNYDEQEQRGGSAELNTGSPEFLRVATDTTNSGTGINLRPDRIRTEENEGREGFAQSEFGKIGRDVAITESKGLEGEDKSGIEERGIREHIRRNAPRYDCKNDASNSNSGRQPGKEHWEAGPGWTAKERFRDNWQNFPTQPPICVGNDGIPTQLDGITFPKWRNESIKAYGNAIVPQVAFELFKIINKINPS